MGAFAAERMRIGVTIIWVKAGREKTHPQAGLGRHTQFLGWGCGFLDFDNDGWPDILICNGHVYPEVEQLRTEAGYAQRKLLYRNLRNGHFEDISMDVGPGISEPTASRGCAFGDFDNDGDVDFVVNCVNDVPQLVRCDSSVQNNWIKVRTIGTKSNRSGIGARLRCVVQMPGETKPHQQVDEVRSGGGYLSQSDLRVHFRDWEGDESGVAGDSVAERVGADVAGCEGESVDLCKGGRGDCADDGIWRWKGVGAVEARRSDRGILRCA